MKLSDFYDEEIIVGYFYGELRGMLETIRRRVFNGRVEYDEMVSELYLFPVNIQIKLDLIILV